MDEMLKIWYSTKQLSIISFSQVVTQFSNFLEEEEEENRMWESDPYFTCDDHDQYFVERFLFEKKLQSTNECSSVPKVNS